MSRAAASGPILSQDEADQALEQFVAEGDRIAANLIDLSGLAAEQPPEGVSAERWGATKAQAELLWTHYDAYRGVLQRARAVRSRRDQLEPQELAELSELLSGATVEMTGTSAGTGRVSLAAAVDRMDSTYQEVTAVAGAGLALHVDPAETTRQPMPAAFGQPPAADPVRPSRAERHGAAEQQGPDSITSQPLPRRSGRRGGESGPSGSGQEAPAATIFQFPSGGPAGGAEHGQGPGGGHGGDPAPGVEWFHGNAAARPRGDGAVPLGRRQPGSSFGQGAPAAGEPGGDGAQWFEGGPAQAGPRPPQPGDSPLARALQRRGTSGPMFPPPGEPAAGQGDGAPAAPPTPWGPGQLPGAPAPTPWGPAGMPADDADRKRPGGLKAVRARLEAGGADGFRRLQGGLKAARARIEARTGWDETWEPGAWGSPAPGQPGAGQPGGAEYGPPVPFPSQPPAPPPGSFSALSPAPPASDPPGHAPAAREANPAAPGPAAPPRPDAGGASGWVDLDPPTTRQPPPSHPAEPPPADPGQQPGPPAARPQPATPPPAAAGATPPSRAHSTQPRASTGGDWGSESWGDQRGSDQRRGGDRGADERATAVRAILAKLEQSSAAQRAVQAEVTAKIAAPALPEVVDLEPLRARVEALEAWQRQAGPKDSQELARELTGVVHDLNEALKSARDAVGNAAGLLERRRELRGRLDAYRAKAKRLGRGQDPLLAECHRRAMDLLSIRPCDLRAATKAVAHYQRVLSDDPSADAHDSDQQQAGKPNPSTATNRARAAGRGSPYNKEAPS